MATALEEAQRMHAGGLSVELIAHATGAARSTVRDWLIGRSVPRGPRAERVSELSALLDRLPRVMSANSISAWLIQPIEALDDDKPIDVIVRGDYGRVARLISELEDPGAV